MKKIFTLTAIMCWFAFYSNVTAQGIYQFYGNTILGAQDNKGSIFSMKYDGTGHQLLKEFEIKNPGEPDFLQKPVLVNGKFYSILGQSFGGGVITEFDPATNGYIRKASFDDINASTPYGAPVLYNGELYGLTTTGGTLNGGVIYRFNPATGVLVKLYEFKLATGVVPQATLTVFNGKLYGTTTSGGTNSDGVLFEFDPATNNYTVKLNFDGDLHGFVSYASLIAYNGLLWGFTGHGGFAGTGGTLFSFNTATNVYSFKKNMSSVGLHSVGGTPVIFNGKLYGCTQGMDGYGGIFEYDFANNILTKKYSFNAQTIYNYSDMVVHNGKFYGSGEGNGENSPGLIFQYDPVTNVYVNKMIFNNVSGYNPTCAMTLHNNKMYVWTKKGGIDDDGTLVEYNPVPNGYLIKVDLGTDARLYNPVATPVYQNGKVYGIMTGGGNEERGGIYEYDLATGLYTDKFKFPIEIGVGFEGTGLLLLNNKLYGASLSGGTDDRGALFEYDLSNNSFAIVHDFKFATGASPYAKLMAFNGKIYGVTSTGGPNGDGTLFEYNPATGIYAVKVNFGNAFGAMPYAGLTAYNNRLYGTTTVGGTENGGVLFEYNPANNSYIVRASFTQATSGVNPSAAMTVHDGKLYGVTEKLVPNNQYEGGIFQFDPVTFVLTKKHSFTSTTTFGARSGMVSMYKKLYGLTTRGGDDDEGVAFEFDPATDVYKNTRHFNQATGRFPGRADMIKVPAKTAAGNPGSCTNAGVININATNNNEWIPVADDSGEAILEIHAGGNNLGNVSVNYYVHDAAVRTDGSGQPYLDRNFTINLQNQPVSQVNVRFYIRKNEFDALKNTPGSNVATIGSLGVFKNDNSCGNALIGTATPVLSSNTAWREDFVLNIPITSSASYYFGFRNFTVLPVNILSFTGSKEATSNKLTWKASCTNPADFTLERSKDGISFTAISTVNASVADCSAPFNYTDANVGNEKYYYRLKSQEQNAAAHYSNIVFLNRSGELVTDMKFVPNPVTGATANLQVSTPKQQAFVITITDASGRTVTQKNISATAGTTQHKVDVSNLSTGMYYLSYINEGKRTTQKFIKQ